MLFSLSCTGFAGVMVYVQFMSVVHVPGIRLAMCIDGSLTRSLLRDQDGSCLRTAKVG